MKYENLQVFYLGCSFGFEHTLQQAKVPLRNVDQNKNVSMYKTNIHMNPGKVWNQMILSHCYLHTICSMMYAAYIITYIKLSPVGVFGGPMVVSMRYIPLDQEWNYCFVIKKFYYAFRSRLYQTVWYQTWCSFIAWAAQVEQYGPFLK